MFRIQDMNYLKKEGCFYFSTLIISALLFQKISLPFTGNLLSAGTLVMPLIVFMALLKGILRINSKGLFSLAFLSLSIGLTIILISPEHAFSIAAIGLILVCQLCLTTEVVHQKIDHHGAMSFYASVMFLLSILGVIQYASEWVLPSAISFPLDNFLPKSIALVGYNNLNPLEYASDKIKSNGVFFAEPSFFSQAIALAALIELEYQRRSSRLIVFAAAMLCSYSGTGLIVLIPFGVHKMLKERQVGSLLCVMLFVGIAVLFASTLQLDTFTRRVGEFGQTDSSGNARFVSIFELIRTFQTDSIGDLFFGMGAGQTTTYIQKLPYAGFGPTWGKVFFEFGEVGLLTYLIFLWNLVAEKESVVKWPILVTYLFLGGYLSDVAVLIPLLLFVSWAPRKRLMA